MGKDILKVIGLQFGIFLVHQLGMYFLIIEMHHYELALLEIILICLHWITLFILMIVFFAMKKTGKGLGYLISFLVLLVVGFGSCAKIFWANNRAEITPQRLEEMRREDSISLYEQKIMDSANKDSVK